MMRLLVAAATLLAASPAAAQANYDTSGLLQGLFTAPGPNGAVRANQRVGSDRPYAEPAPTPPQRSTGLFARHVTTSWTDLVKPQATTPRP